MLKRADAMQTVKFEDGEEQVDRVGTFDLDDIEEMPNSQSAPMSVPVDEEEGDEDEKNNSNNSSSKKNDGAAAAAGNDEEAKKNGAAEGGGSASAASLPKRKVKGGDAARLLDAVEEAALEAEELTGDMFEHFQELMKTYSLSEELAEQMEGNDQPLLRKTKSGSMFPTIEDPKISMTAFVGDLNYRVDLVKLAQNAKLAPFSVGTPCDGIAGLVYDSSDESQPPIVRGEGRLGNKKAFARQVTLLLAPEGKLNVSIKVFNTGRMQIAGCTDVKSCMISLGHIVKALSRLQRKQIYVLSDSTTRAEYTGPEYTISMMKEPVVVNLNCTFDAGYQELNYVLNPDSLVEVLQEPQFSDKIVSAMYTPELRYSGVKIKYRASCDIRTLPIGVPNRDKRVIFIGAFKTGKVVVTGAVNKEEVDDAHAFMKKILYNRYETLRSPRAAFLAKKSQKAQDAALERRRKKNAAAAAAADEDDEVGGGGGGDDDDEYNAASNNNSGSGKKRGGGARGRGRGRGRGGGRGGAAAAAAAAATPETPALPAAAAAPGGTVGEDGIVITRSGRQSKRREIVQDFTDDDDEDYEDEIVYKKPATGKRKSEGVVADDDGFEQEVASKPPLPPKKRGRKPKSATFADAAEIATAAATTAVAAAEQLNFEYDADANGGEFNNGSLNDDDLLG